MDAMKKKPKKSMSWKHVSALCIDGKSEVFIDGKFVKDCKPFTIDYWIKPKKKPTSKGKS